MNFLHAQQSSQPPKPPPGMVQQRVKFEGPNNSEATREEWFIAGTEQATFATASQDKSALAKVARITSPTNGSIIALDPDIPPQRQRLTLQAQGHKLRWLLDGKPLAQGNQALWLPWPGRHTLQVTDAQGKVLDEVKLEVRGAGVKKAAAASAPAP
jgi:penicillin-binding protein 1C